MKCPDCGKPMRKLKEAVYRFGNSDTLYKCKNGHRWVSSWDSFEQKDTLERAEDEVQNEGPGAT